MTKRKSQYSGTLNEPIPGPRSMTLPVKGIFHRPMFPEQNTGQELEWLNDLTHTENKKLLLLFEHYDIPKELPNSIRWKRLARTLARDHVPGFRIKARPGHPLIDKYL